MINNNVYAAPQSANASSASQLKPEFYSPQAIGLATFLGSPIAGIYLLGKNAVLLKRSYSLFGYLVVGLLASTFILGLAFILPDEIPSSVFTVMHASIAFGMKEITDKTQGKFINKQLAEGARQASNAKAAGIGLAIGMIFILLALLTSFIIIIAFEIPMDA